ncbi:hypothetical protein GK047_21260 [Paenibacillus sp. SYP-B3998]|uniref:Uncharacterized protein n=1 Tax=Paenibacillus sp. SYP-B3998 TaxID=2678564 RepID=A0A6G4A3Y5_9BACL|nr:hypothetical protein [Paenibacillus sp. SYP-B3998]NEW08531.1 hypothetical protein [Paenibacillus sp. SYP-B3998]
MLGGVTVLVVSVAACFASIEMPRLYKKGWRKELYLYVALLTLGVTLSTIIAFKATVRSPLEILVFIYKPINEWVGSLF